MKEKRYVVFEYNENASPEYVGSRFYTSWTEPIVLKENDHHDIIAENISNDEAQTLVRQTSDKNSESYLNSIPSELRDERTDSLIRGWLK